MNWIPYFFFILSGILIIRRFFLIKSSWKRNRNFVLRIFVISFIGLFSYFVTIELATPRSFYFMIPILFYSFFFFSYFLERRRLLNGMLFNLFILSTLLYIVFLFLKTDNQVILYLLTFLIIRELFNLTISYKFRSRNSFILLFLLDAPVVVGIASFCSVIYIIILFGYF